MKAAMLIDPGRLEIKEIPTPGCPKGGVLVKVIACGICMADVKMVTKGHRALVYPRILGHEIAGVVEKSQTKRFKEGDRVQVGPGIRCGRCVKCLMGTDNQCKDRGILGFSVDGGFAHYIPVPLEGRIVGALNLLPENVSYEAATLAEPLACCINAQNKINTKKGNTFLIIGAGPLGLLHCFAARCKGARKIIISETQAHRRQTAVNFWADRVIDPAHDNLFETVMEATDEKGVDVIIFACSHVGLDESFMKLLAPNGRVSIFSGTTPQISRTQLDLNLIHYNEIVIAGAYGSTANQNMEAIGLISSSRLPPGELITSRVSLDNIKEGFAYTKSNKALKSIVEVQNG